MSALRVISRNRGDEIVGGLIRKGTLAVLSHHGPDGWCTCRTHVMSGSRQADSLSLQTQLGPTDPGYRLPLPGETVGMSFRFGHKKCMFASVVKSTTEHHDGSRLTLRWPDKIHLLQRRMYERAVPPRGCVIPVRFWQQNSPSAAPTPNRRVKHGQLENLSASGMRIQTAGTGDIEVEQAYQCVFAPWVGAPALVLEAILRRAETTDEGRASLGFHFIGLETTSEGCKTLDRLARIVNQWQRAQVRSSR